MKFELTKRNFISHFSIGSKGACDDAIHLVGRLVTSIYRVFSHDVTAAMLVSQNNETAAMLVSQTSPVGVELLSYANTFFCSNKFA